MDKITEYLTAYLKPALKIELKYGVSAIVALAQSALESGFAASKPGNMMFGIKAGSSWTGKKQLLKTTEVLASPDAKFPEIISKTLRPDGKYTYIVRDWFRAYNTPEDSFEDYAKLIVNNARYKTALSYKSDPFKFIEQIVKGGYATDPDYLKKMKQLISQILEKKKLLPE